MTKIYIEGKKCCNTHGWRHHNFPRFNFFFNADGNKSIKNAKLYIVEGKVIGNLNSGRKWHFRTKHRWWLGRIIPLVCRGKHPRSGSPYVLTNANRHWKWDAYYFFLNGIDVTVPVNGNLNSFKYNKLYKL